MLLAHKPVALKLTLAKRSFIAFIKQAWPYVENVPYQHGRHIEVLANQLVLANTGEQRFQIHNLPPRHTKPLCVDTRVVTKAGIKRLGDIEVGDQVLTHRGRFRPVTAVHEQGELFITTLKTALGRTIRAAPDHPFLTPHGWKPAAELRVGSLLGVPRVAEPWQSKMSPEEARLLGYFVGDGCTTQSNANITCCDPEQEVDIFACVRAMGFEARRESMWYETPRKAILVRNGVRPWLIHHGLKGKRSNAKRIPPEVFASREALINFLAAYFACDGTANPRGGKRDDLAISMTTVSDDLAEDLVLAFGLLGIRARRKVRRIKGGYIPKGREDTYTANIITITSADDADRFRELIPVPGCKLAKLHAWQLDRRGFDPEIAGDPVIEIGMDEPAPCRCLTVGEDGSFTAEGVAVKNSGITAVFWPAWTWLQDEGAYPLAGPWVQFMFVSHSDQIASRDSWKCRQLVSSEWYQTLCDKKVTVQGGGIGSWSLATGGARMALSIRTGITGLGADVQVVDDPSDVYKVESAADRKEVRTVFFDSLPSRFNHPSKKAQIVTCQRTHRYDLTGMILEDHPEQWEHVCLPAHYDPDHPHRWRGDWRRRRGTLLWPERFTEEALDELARTAYARASQLEQNPRARGGAIFSDANFKVVDTAPSNLRLTRFWDFASTEEGEAADPDYTAGVLGGADKDGIFWVVDVVHARLSPLNRRRKVEQTARLDGKRVAIAIEEEPGSAGKDVIASYKELLRGYAVRGRKATGDKLTRIDPYLAATEAGNVYILNKPWTREFLREHEEWTGGDDEHDDIIVATAGCHTEASRVLSFKPW